MQLTPGRESCTAANRQARGNATGPGKGHMAKKDVARPRSGLNPAANIKQTREQLKATAAELRERARQMRREQTQQLREFRSQVATLKRQGILSRKYDARSVAPSKYLKSVVREFRDVAMGAAKTVKAPRELRQRYADAGYKVRAGRIVMPVPSPKSVVRAGKDRIIIRAPKMGGEIEQVSFPVRFTEARSFLEGMRGHPEFDQIKNPGERWAFTFYGRNSHATYDSLDDAIDDLDRYESIEAATDKGDAEGMRSIFQNLSFFRVKHASAWARSPKQKRERTSEQKRRARERRRRHVERMSDAERQEKRDAAREAMRQRRAIMSEEQQEARRERNREAMRDRRKLQRIIKKLPD